MAQLQLQVGYSWYYEAPQTRVATLDMQVMSQNMLWPVFTVATRTDDVMPNACRHFLFFELNQDPAWLGGSQMHHTSAPPPMSAWM